MRIVDLIEKKKLGKVLTKEEINFIIDSLMDGTAHDYQLSAWLMAVYFQSLTEEETAYLTEAMINSGEVIDFGDLSKYKEPDGYIPTLEAMLVHEFAHGKQILEDTFSVTFNIFSFVTSSVTAFEVVLPIICDNFEVPIMVYFTVLPITFPNVNFISNLLIFRFILQYLFSKFWRLRMCDYLYPVRKRLADKIHCL